MDSVTTGKYQYPYGYASYEYSPYGATSAHLGASGSAFGYASAWTDPAAGTDYLRAREYDPITGQFLQVDPVVDATRQPYAHVGGAPLSAADPMGLCVGMDDTPQDRPCTANDFFWHDLPGVVADSVRPTFAGLAAGSTFGVGLLTNNDLACYGDDPWFWASYGLGVAYSAVSLYSAGSALLGTGATKAATTVTEGLSSNSTAGSSSSGFIGNSVGDILDTSRISIPEGKLGYLLENPSKSGIFADSMGFDQANLGAALRSHLTTNFGNASTAESMIGGGFKFSVRGSMTGPSGETWGLTTAWGIDVDGTVRLITGTP